jgi:cytidyltransferase-like protein
MTRFPEASAHGRFQPFHLGHLEYILAAKEACDFLWIGITKYDITPGTLNPLGTKREHPASNPFTYFERLKMITAALIQAGVSREAFGFIPFPIETPVHLPAFLPLYVPCFTTICEPWNREKIAVLQQAGYSVHVLWDRAKTISADTIRQAILNGDDGWRKLVPNAVAEALDEMNPAERVRAVARTSISGV